MAKRITYRNSQLHRCTCEVLREARERAGMTQFAVSAVLKRHKEFCNKVEHGQMMNYVEFIVYCRAVKTTAGRVAEEAERRAMLKAQPLPRR